MTTTLEALIPTRWFRKNEGDWSMSDDVIVPPPIAAIPRQPETDEEKRLATIATAHVYVEQLRQERATQLTTIEQLKSELENLTRLLKQEERKSGLLELELTQALNNMQTREADFAEKDRCLSLLRQVLDKFGTKAPPKPERKPKKKKADGEAADQAPKADG